MCKEGNNVDDVTHHFIECSGLNDNIWNVFENWWNRTADYQFKLCNKHIMFGIYYDNKFMRMLIMSFFLLNGVTGYIKRSI